MKKQTLLLTALVLTIALSANAQQARLSPAEKQKIAWAIKILVKHKVISKTQDQCLDIDNDLLKLLENEGLLNQSDVSPQAICGGEM